MSEDALKQVGFWWHKSFADSERYKFLPKAEDHVDPTWDRAERLMVLNYVRAGKVLSNYRGMSSCRFCECHNGSADLTDGFYVWPSGFGHYLEEHGVKPPKDFIDHVKKMLRVHQLLKDMED